MLFVEGLRERRVWKGQRGRLGGKREWIWQGKVSWAGGSALGEKGKEEFGCPFSGSRGAEFCREFVISL